MAESVTLSVIIPLFNVEDYISDCIEGLFRQVIPGIEIICVDDHSTDSSGMIVRKYCEKHDYIKLITLDENHGQAYARNCGLSEASGRYVFFMDADDHLVDDDCLRQMLERIEEGLDGVFFDFKFEYESESIKKQYCNRIQVTQSFGEIKTSGIDLISKLLNEEEIWLSVWREIWSREYLLNNNLEFIENTSPHEDLLFSFKAISKASSIKYINKPVYVYYLRSGSSTAGDVTPKRHIAHLRCLIEGIRAWRDNCFEENGEALILYIYYIKRFMKQAMRSLLECDVDIWNLCGISEYERTILRLTYLEEYPNLKRIVSLIEYKKLKKADDVIIYGAGKVGQDVMRMAGNLGIEDCCFAASKAYPDKGVLEIGEALRKSLNPMIILASMNPSFRNEMIKVLDKEGINEYIDLFSEVV